MMWKGEDAKVTWTFRRDGRFRRQGNWRTPGLPASHYPRELLSVLAVAEARTGLGPYAADVQTLLVAKMNALDAALERVARELREFAGAIRLYPHDGLDTWRFRELFGARKSQHLSLGMAEERAARLPAQERATVNDAVGLLRRRQDMRRILRVIAELTEAGGKWPGGEWVVKGYGGAEQGVTWTVWAGNWGRRWRYYGTGTGAEDAALRNGSEGDADSDAEA
jgi:hypothetical protein